MTTVSLADVGRAERKRLADGSVVWSLPRADGELAESLMSASKRGLFGFSDHQMLADGRHSLSRKSAATLADATRAPMPWRDAIVIVRTLLRAQAELEARGYDAYALSTNEVTLEPPTLLATPTLSRLLGADVTPPRVSARWSSPEVADGAPWDHAASRYFLALVAYRLIAGELPRAEGGVRAALESRARWGVPPFPDELASGLAPGVQSVILGWLGRDRPESASDMVAACDELLGNAPKRAVAAARPTAKRAVATTPRTKPRSSLDELRRRAWALPLVVALVALALSSALVPAAKGEARPQIRAASQTGTSPQDCAPCHAREVNEWQRSVMSQASASPLFGALESEVEEQVGRDDRCPNGAGALRFVSSNSSDSCTDERTLVRKTGSGGEGWCVNCHMPGANLERGPRATWSALGNARDRAPLRDMLPSKVREGVSCVSCHTTVGPVDAHARARGGYEGNPTWISTVTGREFASRPEDDEGRPGIANSGYRLDPALMAPRTPTADWLAPHPSPSNATASYMRSSEMCGACHDVRLFGTDVLGAERGEHMKRLRNAYSEWRVWSEERQRKGRSAPSCQGCHMSRYPGVCLPNASAVRSAADEDCPAGTHFEARAASDDAGSRTHYFTSVDLPLSPDYPDTFLSERTLDAGGTPLGLRARRNILLKRTFDFRIGDAQLLGNTLEVPVRVENVGAGHRVPAGFSQEREVWVELRVEDARGDFVYEVGRVERDDEDLHDKSFQRINVRGGDRDGLGRPLGVFGASVSDGPDAPRWSPPPSRGGADFRGLGLLNLQNGFLRCVRCIGTIDERGECQPNADQRGVRGDRFADGVYDLDTGACTSNLTGQSALFETYFPVGALDAERGIAKAPDAIIDTRSAPPDVPITYTYAIDVGRHPAPFTARARLRFRAFPPYLVRAFADYEALAAADGSRPSGAQVTTEMLSRVEIVDLGKAEVVVR